MATQTYAQLQKQIEALKVQAERLKTEEVAGVVARIKEAVSTYGLKPQDLFGTKSDVAKTKVRAKGAAKRKASYVAKYIDGKGGQWVGQGKRPKWLSDALAAGKQLEDFLAEKFMAAVETFSSPPAQVVAPVQAAAPPKSAKRAAKRSKKVQPSRAGKKAASSAKYADGAGNSWSGFGPTPRWLKEAIAGGKMREDFLVKA